MGRDTLIIMALCEDCRNACKMKAPKGSTLKCPNYKKIPASWRKINFATLRDQQTCKQERIMKNAK